MPKAFMDCISRGGKVRTIKPQGRRSATYIHVCYSGGKSYSGEVMHRRRGANKEGGKRFK